MNLFMTPVDPAGFDLAITNPAIWGPLAASIAAAFIFEIIVPGRAYKRLQDENSRLRVVIESAIPLATAAIKEHTTASIEQTHAINTALDAIDTPARARSRRP